MPDFQESLRQEIDQLDRELRQTAHYKKIVGLKSVLALYDSSGVSSESDEPPTREDMEASLSRRTVTRVPSETRVKAMELAELFLRNRSGPTPTREILDHIITHGGVIGGQEPVSNLSAMLSNSGIFQSHGRIGWTLKKGDLVEIPDTVFQDIAEDILADFESDRLSALYDKIRTGHQPIPADLDSQILSEVRRRVNRMLTDQELKRMRHVFSDVLEKQVFP